MKKATYILIVPFLLLSCHAQIKAPVPSTPIIADKLVCRPDVRAAMVDAWGATGNGTSGTEAGFSIDAGKRGNTIVPHERTNERGMLTTVIEPNTTAEFHVHPLGSGGAPSTPENNVLGDPDHGDTLVADEHFIDIYTFNEQGLFVYRWKTKQITKLRDGYEWQQPCLMPVVAGKGGDKSGSRKPQAGTPSPQARKQQNVSGSKR